MYLNEKVFIEFSFFYRKFKIQQYKKRFQSYNSIGNGALFEKRVNNTLQYYHIFTPPSK